MLPCKEWRVRKLTLQFIQASVLRLASCLGGPLHWILINEGFSLPLDRSPGHLPTGGFALGGAAGSLPPVAPEGVVRAVIVAAANFRGGMNRKMNAHPLALSLLGSICPSIYLLLKQLP